MGFEGVVIDAAHGGKPVFDFWSNTEKPDFQGALLNEQPLWFDPAHAVLYSKINMPLRGPGQQLNMQVFKAWDSATLKRLNFNNSVSLLALGNRALLSSEGNLALAEAPPATLPYSTAVRNSIPYQEGRIIWTELKYPDGQSVPIYLNLRSPLTNNLPIALVLSASVGTTLLFGLLLFMTIGHWLRQLGARLDQLSAAALGFHKVENAPANIQQLREVAANVQTDQVSMLAQELTNLMQSSIQRDEEQRAYLQTLSLLQDAVIELTPDGRFLRATDA